MSEFSIKQKRDLLKSLGERLFDRMTDDEIEAVFEADKLRLMSSLVDSMNKSKPIFDDEGEFIGILPPVKFGGSNE